MMNDPTASSPHRLARRPWCRRGTTLVEVLGTLSVLLVLGVSAAGILAAITEIGVRTGAAKQGRASVQRLAEVIRRDVHDAASVEDTDAWPLDLIDGDVSVRYQWDAQTHCIRRTVTDGQTQKGIDRFVLPQPCDPQVSTNDQMVTVMLRQGGQTQIPWIIEASRK